MTFEAEGLPHGLSLDKETGIITGKVRKAGEYKVTLKAVNNLGSDERVLRIIIGDRIALTPPMGWNSWNCWREFVDQEKVMSSINGFLEKGLDRYGWSYINIDDGWQGTRGGEYNAIQPNSKFHDMKALSDFIHSKGLKFGIYSSPWVGTPGAHIGTSCDSPNGKYDWVEDGRVNEFFKYKGDGNEFHYLGKHSFAEQDVRQWADWDVDYLKYDWHPNDAESIMTMSRALRSSGRDIVLSLSNRAPFALARVYLEYAECWRTTSDITDEWSSLERIGLRSMDHWAGFQGPGHWPDADMLEIGRVRVRGSGTRPCKLTPDEQYAHITLWCMLASPLLIGCDMSDMDDFTVSLLTNNEVIDVNQDPLGIQAVRYRPVDRFADSYEEAQILMKPLEDGTFAIAIFNLSDEERMIGFSPATFQLGGKQTVRDLWRQRDVAELEGNMRWETLIGPHGAALYRLSPGGIKK